jgi:hypothetical protein
MLYSHLGTLKHPISGVKMINFAKVLDAELAEQQGAEQRKKLVPGIYKTVIKGVSQRTFESGAEALQIEYSIIDGDFTGLSVIESLFHKGKEGKDNEIGAIKIRRRLLTAGFTKEQLAKFRSPKSEKDIGDFVKLIGKQFMVTTDNREIKSGKMAGRTVQDVKRVEPVVE